MTVLSYFLVIFLGPIVLTLTVMLLGFLVSLLFAWAPLTFRVATASTIAGAVGAIVVTAFSYWLFNLLAHKGLESWSPLIASTIALLIPFLNDRRKAKEISVAFAELPTAVQAETTSTRTNLALQSLGYAVGFLLVASWLLLRSAA